MGSASELIFRMKHAKTDSSYYDRNLVPRAQVVFVKEVSDYITKNLNGKITVKQLTLEFGISDTYLQNAFRSVYGMPVISFIRAQKMQSAAQELIRTGHSIDEIAEKYGYENESKYKNYIDLAAGTFLFGTFLFSFGTESKGFRTGL